MYGSVFDRKVARLIIGTHHNRFLPKALLESSNGTGLGAHHVHDALRALLLRHGWRIVWDVPMNDNYKCVLRYLRGNYQTPPTADRFKWAAMLRRPACTHATPRGPVAHWDGELIADNPRLVHRGTPGFSFDNEELIVDDLLS